MIRLGPARLAIRVGLAVCSAFAACAGAQGPGPIVRSPDGNHVIELTGIGDGPAALGVNVSRGDKRVLEIRSLTVGLAGRGGLSGSATLQGTREETIDESFTLAWGKTVNVTNQCRRVVARLIDQEGIEWDLELVAYDEGVAFRYGLPKQEKIAEFTLTGETAEYRFTGTPTMHYTTHSTFENAHEAEFRRDPLDGLAGSLIDLPLLAVWPDGSAAAITEARLRDFSSLYFAPVAGREKVLRSLLTPHPGQDGACVIGRTPHTSPWRVVLLGESAGRLLESNLLLCLNDPPAGDFSWAKPGKTTWQWWNGTFDHDPSINPGMNLETHKRYIDFCANNGIAYHAVVADRRPWYVQAAESYAPQPDTDILTPRPELNLPEILAYARERGVGIRLWVHWKPLENRLDEAFQQYEDWGITGLMVDFLDRDDQYMVGFCERVLESAARHKLHIQFHGSYKPSGEQRTYPNLFNREGVLNLEYLKWSDRCTPPHNVEAAYVRALAGPLDYHLGGFRSISRSAFVARNENPYVLGTRCHHLAMYVVYDNPMPQVCDTPEAYEGEPGFDFIVNVPVTWDETRFVAGDAGDFIVMARRKGSTWYLGGMTDWTPRELEIPLDFLEAGRYTARLYVDGSMDEEKPNAIRIESQTVDAATPIPVAMAPGGGFAAVLTPR